MLKSAFLNNRIKSASIFCLFIITLFAFFTPTLVRADQINSAPFSGTGTDKDPYLINDEKDFAALRDLVNEGVNFTDEYFLLTSDIDFSDMPWKPIGGQEETNAFAGILDGSGHTLTGIDCSADSSANNQAALFNRLNGTIVNVAVKDSSFTGAESATFAIHGTKNARIVNCMTDASISGNIAAGIACSFEDGTIANCVSLGAITGNNSAGIVATDGNTKVYRCYSNTLPLIPEGIVTTNSFFADDADEVPTRKLSISSTLSKYLFLGDINVETLGWEKASDGIRFANNAALASVTHVINSYLLPALLILGMAYYWIRIKNGVKNPTEKYRISKSLRTNLAALVIITFFCDSYLLARGLINFDPGKVAFILLLHLTIGLAITWFVKNGIVLFRLPPRSTMVIIAIVVAFEIIQFNNLPRYDANIYYGSLIEATHRFNFDLISFIGAFNCWKWAQGVALFLAPFEFMLPSSSVSIYLGNILITIITIVILERLLTNLFKNLLTPVQKALLTLVFMFSPYIMGMFTYLSMDWQIAFFAVWLIYAIQHRSNLGICYCGFLLAFTKITGLAFYVFVLLFYTAINAYQHRSIMIEWRKTQFAAKIAQYILWILPAVAYLFIMLYGDELTSQNFYGTFVSDSMIAIGDINQIANTALHAFVFGFRWVGVGIVLIAIICSARKLGTSSRISRGSLRTLLAVLFAAFATAGVLMVYKSDANCPRYTSIFSSLYSIGIGYAACTLFNRQKQKSVFLVGLAALMIVQTYWTIDPSITFYCESIPIGKTRLYKLAYKNDKRPGMNLVSDSNSNYPILGDLYAYNYQYTFYDDLVDKMLSLAAKDSAPLYILNVDQYELNVSGRGYGEYNLYYDTSRKGRTFNGDLPNAKYTPVYLLMEYNVDVDLPQCFWLVEPYRMYSSPAPEKLVSQGYEQFDKHAYSNCYGELSISRFEKGDE